MNKEQFVVVMDLPNAQAGHMPRRFYRALNKLADVERLQKSVYLVTGVTGREELIRLGCGCGFSVQAFQVCGRNMSSERPRPKITEEAARILRKAARVAECRLKERGSLKPRACS